MLGYVPFKYFKYIYSMGSGQTGIKLGTKNVIYQKLATFTKKLTVLKVSFLACVYFTGQNIMQRGHPMEFNFEVLERQR